jgi:hypothetical protein
VYFSPGTGTNAAYLDSSIGSLINIEWGAFDSRVLPRTKYDIEVKTTLVTSGEDPKLHSERVEKIRNYTRNEWRRSETTLEMGGELRSIAVRRILVNRSSRR